MKTASQPTCGVLYQESVAQFCVTDAERAAFAAGHVSGQAEKVYLGACRAAMFRPQPENMLWLLSVVEKVAERYGLRVECLSYDFKGLASDEIWISRNGFTQDLAGIVVNSRTWHVLRGRACGIPDAELDCEFHFRQGYNKPCDRPAPTRRSP